MKTNRYFQLGLLFIGAAAVVKIAVVFMSRSHLHKIGGTVDLNPSPSNPILVYARPWLTDTNKIAFFAFTPTEWVPLTNAWPDALLTEQLGSMRGIQLPQGWVFNLSKDRLHDMTTDASLTLHTNPVWFTRP